MKKLYAQHISTLQKWTEGILEELSLDGLVIGSGNAHYYFEDDQESPFRPNHHFSHWLPLATEENALVIQKGKKPQLLAFMPEDFWHEHKSLADNFWVEQFSVKEFPKAEEIWQHLEDNFSGCAYHGPQKEAAVKYGLKVDVDGLLPRLDWNRSYKTPYEVDCLEEASRLGALGHKAAKQAFEMGESELGIHHAFLVSTRMRDQDLPYESIVCLNEKGAFLHYKDKRDEPRNGKVLLIDAGCQFNGYASDITRTYCRDDAHPVFKELLVEMEKLQVKLCKMPKLGMTMADLHWESHLGISQILIDQEILLGVDAETAVKDGLSANFYPHGIGHMLGLFVHDVAGRQINPRGDDGEADPRFPKLRSLRALEEGHYFTIEPGLYFIKILLDKCRVGEHKDRFNWKLIDQLIPFGGIRIEDNILMTKKGPRNITREFL